MVKKTNMNCLFWAKVRLIASWFTALGPWLTNYSFSSYSLIRPKDPRKDMGFGNDFLPCAVACEPQGITITLYSNLC